MTALASTLAVAVLAVACGDDGGSGDPSDAVKSLVEESFPNLDVSADCPDEASGRFDCRVTVGGDTVTLPVEDVDGEVELRSALVNLGDVERTIETRYDEEQGIAASAECGDDAQAAVLVERVGATFTCTVEPSGGRATSEATVTVDNLDGKVSIDL